MNVCIFRSNENYKYNLEQKMYKRKIKSDENRSIFKVACNVIIGKSRPFRDIITSPLQLLLLQFEDINLKVNFFLFK